LKKKSGDETMIVGMPIVVQQAVQRMLMLRFVVGREILPACQAPGSNASMKMSIVPPQTIPSSLASSAVNEK
jgi:hypothetical protein